MNQELITQELGIIVAAKNHPSTVLNPEFLKYSGIVPSEWEIARQPIYSQNVSQIAFTNGVVIIAEAGRAIFIEAIENKPTSEIFIAEVAKNYAKTLLNLEYEAVGINPRGYITFDKQGQSHQYIENTLLSKGTWREIGNAPMRATLNLAYTLERSQMYLTISEAALRNSDETNTPIVLFNGSFSYPIVGENTSERLVNLHQILDNWKADLSIYQEIISNNFIMNKVVVSDIFDMNTSAVA